MDATSTTPDGPDASGMESGEVIFLPYGSLAGPRKTGTGPKKTAAEDDWTLLATGDPAFWLKEYE